MAPFEVAPFEPSAGGFRGGGFGETAASASTAAAAPPAPSSNASIGGPAEISVQINAINLLPEAVSRLRGRGGVALAVDVLGLDDDPPMTKAAIDGSGAGSLAFSRAYAATQPPYVGAISAALAADDDEESEIQFVVFNLDGLHPHGEPEEEVGMASISLKKLLKKERDHALGSLRLLGVDGERLGTLTCAVTAVSALKMIQTASVGGGGGSNSRSDEVASASFASSPAPIAFTFGPGPLGLVLLDGKPSGVTISQVDADGQGAAMGVPPMSSIVGLNGEMLPPGLTREGLIKMIKAQSRPLTLLVQPGAPPVHGKQSATPAAPNPTPLPQPYEAQLAELSEMGFVDRAAALRALEASRGDVGGAAMALSE